MLKSFSKADFSKHHGSIGPFPNDHLHIKHNHLDNTPYLYATVNAGFTIIGLVYTAMSTFFMGYHKIAILSASLTPASMYVCLRGQEYFAHTSRKCFDQLHSQKALQGVEFAIEIDKKISVLRLDMYGDCVKENTPQLSNHFAVSSEGDLYNFCDKEHETWLSCIGSTQTRYKLFHGLSPIEELCI